MSHLPIIVLLGAPGTGVQALRNALQQRLAAGAARIVGGGSWEEVSAEVLEPRASRTVLLLGMDLPCPAADRPAQEAADAGLRAAMADAGVAYRVVYGVGERRIAHALDAIKNIAPGALPSSGSEVFPSGTDQHPGRAARLRAWNCEKCSDPECEHRLFTALTGNHAGRAG